MNITKYPQSCILVEKNNTRIVIDPGEPFSEQFDVDDLGHLDAVLFTHQHADHIDESIIDTFVGLEIPMYANEATAKLIESNVTKVHENDTFTIGDMVITARELPHCLMPDGSEGPQNTGYVVNDYFFHPGDGVSIDDLTVPVLAAPMAGPDISPKDVLDFITQVNAKHIVPIHNDLFVVDVNKIIAVSKQFGFDQKWTMLDNGESITI